MKKLLAILLISAMILSACTTGDNEETTTPTPSVTPIPGGTPGPTGTPSPTPDATGTPGATPTPSPTVQPGVTPTPSPTVSPTPSATPTGAQRGPTFSFFCDEEECDTDSGSVLSGCLVDYEGKMCESRTRTYPPEDGRAPVTATSCSYRTNFCQNTTTELCQGRFETVTHFDAAGDEVTYSICRTGYFVDECPEGSVCIVKATEEWDARALERDGIRVFCDGSQDTGNSITGNVGAGSPSQTPEPYEIGFCAREG